MSVSSSSSTVSSSFMPRSSSTLSPLSAAGLCEAETMIAPAKSSSAGDVGERRRRQDAREVHVRAEAGRAGGDRGDEHVARAAGVLADDERTTRAGEPPGGGATEGEGERRLQVDVGDAADAVGPEEPAHGRVAGHGATDGSAAGVGDGDGDGARVAAAGGP